MVGVGVVRLDAQTVPTNRAVVDDGLRVEVLLRGRVGVGRAAKAGAGGRVGAAAAAAQQVAGRQFGGELALELDKAQLIHGGDTLSVWLCVVGTPNCGRSWCAV